MSATRPTNDINLRHPNQEFGLAGTRSQNQRLKSRLTVRESVSILHASTHFLLYFITCVGFKGTLSVSPPALHCCIPCGSSTCRDHEQRSVRCGRCTGPYSIPRYSLCCPRMHTFGQVCRRVVRNSNFL